MKDNIKYLIDSLNKAEIGADGGGKTGYGTDLGLKSHVPFGIPSRMPLLDLAMGRPGYPAGRITELYGVAATGKTTAAYHALAQVQKMGGVAVLIDTEGTFDVKRAEECGLNASSLLISNANDIEEIFEKIDKLLDDYLKKEELKAHPIVIAIDSITAVETRFMSERELRDEPKPGEDARAIRRGLRKINKNVGDSKACLIFINHAISNFKGFGKQTDSAGGNALKLFSSQRIEFQFKSNITEGKDADKFRRGQSVVVSPQKNKNAALSLGFDAELTENGFDLYDGLMKGFEQVGLLERTNNINWHFLPTETTFTKKEWKVLLDTWANKEGKVLGVDGWYQYFLRVAVNDKLILPYGDDNDSGDEPSDS